MCLPIPVGWPYQLPQCHETSRLLEAIERRKLLSDGEALRVSRQLCLLSIGSELGLSLNPILATGWSPKTSSSIACSFALVSEVIRNEM